MTRIFKTLAATAALTLTVGAAQAEQAPFNAFCSQIATLGAMYFDDRVNANGANDYKLPEMIAAIVAHNADNPDRDQVAQFLAMVELTYAQPLTTDTGDVRDAVYAGCTAK